MPLIPPHAVELPEISFGSFGKILNFDFFTVCTTYILLPSTPTEENKLITESFVRITVKSNFGLLSTLPRP